MSIVRCADNPLIRPADVKPSREGYEVVGVMNAGATCVGDETLLLLRVAECPTHEPDEVVAPFLHPEDLSKGIKLLRVKKDDPDLERTDRRVFRYKGRLYLTSISHLRLARSKDGLHFQTDDVQAMVPERRDEEFGIEDPRITRIGDVYYINYTAVARTGIATALAVTRDFKTFERKGLIFSVENRDVTIFPEQVSGQYVCYHRPMTSGMGGPDIWFARSPDLVHWGEHARVCGPRAGCWDGWKIGGGAVPIQTSRGWLAIYHGADDTQRYALGLLLAELDRPDKVIVRSREPVLAPEAPYEVEGFFGNVVFTCGAIVKPDGRVTIYYGAADECIAAAETTIDDLLATLA